MKNANTPQVVHRILSSSGIARFDIGTVITLNIQK